MENVIEWRLYRCGWRQRWSWREKSWKSWLKRLEQSRRVVRKSWIEPVENKTEMRQAEIVCIRWKNKTMSWEVWAHWFWLFCRAWKVELSCCLPLLFETLVQMLFASCPLLAHRDNLQLLENPPCTCTTEICETDFKVLILELNFAYFSKLL